MATHFFLLRIVIDQRRKPLHTTTVNHQKIRLKMVRQQSIKAKPEEEKSKTSSRHPISFSKLGKFLGKNAAVAIQKGKVGNLNYSSSSKGVQFSEWIFRRINYSDRLYFCNQKGKVKVRAYFDKQGRFEKNKSNIQSNFPMLKEHTIKTLQGLVLPYYLSGPLQINLLLDYIRTPAASHSQRFILNDFYFMQILSNDINKGHVSRLDTKNCTN